MMMTPGSMCHMPLHLPVSVFQGLGPAGSQVGLWTPSTLAGAHMGSLLWSKKTTSPKKTRAAQAKAEATLDAELAALAKVESCKVTRAVDKKDFTAYIIECTAVAGSSPRTWRVARRYSEFDRLFGNLIAADLEAVQSFALPSKFNALWKSKESIESERVTKLGAWVEAVVQAVSDAQPAKGDRPLVSTANKPALKAWLQFLQPDNSAPEPEPEAEPAAVVCVPAAAEPAEALPARQPASVAATQEEEAIAVVTADDHAAVATTTTTTTTTPVPTGTSRLPIPKSPSCVFELPADDLAAIPEMVASA
jgi:hypothetical protein